MSVISAPADHELDEVVRAVYADIKETFGIPMVPELFQTMAHHPAYLEATWARVKAVMMSGRLDRKTKELIAVAVSAVNGCHYCVEAHSAMLKAMGVDEAELTEALAVADVFNGLNAFAMGSRV